MQKETRTELIDPSMRHISDSFLQIEIGVVSIVEVSANSTSGCDCLSTTSDGMNLRLREASRASLIL